MNELVEMMNAEVRRLELPLLCDCSGHVHGDCSDCMNTRVVVQCEEDELMLDAAGALRQAAQLLARAERVEAAGEMVP